MATTAMTIAAERWLDEVVLVASVADVAAATLNENFTLPAGLGDVAIMSVIANIASIGTVPVAATFDRGIRGHIISGDQATVVDIVAVSQWFAVGGDGATFTTLSTYMNPDALVLWRQDERLNVIASELDASTTGDLSIRVKVVRVRPIESPASTTIQLVR